MSADQTTSVAITAASGLLGHAITSFILRHHRDNHSVVRAITQHPGRVEDLKKLGAEIHEIDYDKPETLEKSFTGKLNWVIFVVEDDDDRIKKADRAIEIMKNVEVQNVILMSIVGADSDKERLKEFGEIENSVKKILEKWCVIRSAFFDQNLFLFVPMIKEHGKVRMTLSPSDHRFAPINIVDICKAVSTCVSKLEHQNIHKTITFTGPEAISSQEIVNKLNTAVKSEYSYEEISRDKLREYLESSLDVETKQNDVDNFKPSKDQITKTYVETFLDLLEWIKTSDDADKVTDDLKGIIGEPGEKIEVFFKDNADDFKPHHQ